MKDENLIHIGSGNHLVIQTSYVVSMVDELRLFSGDGQKPIDLQIQIKANFEKIPEQYHQTFLSMMSARYGGVVNLYDNTEPLPFQKRQEVKKRWYQFWKK
jgi:hypothetical protein